MYIPCCIILYIRAVGDVLKKISESFNFYVKLSNNLGANCRANRKKRTIVHRKKEL